MKALQTQVLGLRTEYAVATGHQQSAISHPIADDRSPMTDDPTPLLILPGWGGSVETWTKFVEGIEEADHTKTRSHENTILVLSLPGFGGTEQPREAWTSREYADFVLAFLDEMKIERAVILGHSHGGRTAVRLAERHPERVAKLILAAPALIPIGPSLRSRVADVGQRLLAVAPGLNRLRPLARRLIGTSDWRALDSVVMKETFQNVVREDMRNALPRIREIPTAILWGTRDAQTPIRDGREIARLLPDAMFVELPGVRHGIHHEAPEALAATIRGAMGN